MRPADLVEAEEADLALGGHGQRALVRRKRAREVALHGEKRNKKGV